MTGLSLIELMIGMTVGLVATGAMVVVYSSSQRTNRVISQISRTQQDFRYAFHVIGEDLSRAGSFGCAPPNAPAEVITTGSPATYPLAYLPWGVTTDLMANTLSIAYMKTPAALNSDYKAGDMALSYSSTAPINANDEVMLADCSKRALFKIGSPAVTGPVLTGSFSAPETLIGSLERVVYSLCGNHLCRETTVAGTRASAVIAENVSAMTAIFGYAQGNNDFVSYLSAVGPTSTSDRPVYVDISLTFSTTEDVNSATPLAAPIQRVFSTSYALSSHIRRPSAVSPYTEPTGVLDPAPPVCP